MSQILHQPQLHGFLVEVLRLCVWLSLLAVIFLPLERLFALHPQKILRPAIGIDLGFYFLSGLLPGLILAAPLSLVAWAGHRLVPDGLHAAVAACPVWPRAAAARGVGGIGVYWGHRWSHEIPLLWRFHRVHHQAGQMDFMVHTRAHPVDMVFTRLVGLVPLYVLGLAQPTGGAGSLVPLLVTLLATIWGFLIHANLRWRLGALEWLVSTPAFHHWHHTLDGPIDRNYASMLPWLDRVFGTHHLPRDRWPAAYGIGGEPPAPS